MVSIDRRVNPRIDSPNLMFFFCYDDSQNEITQGMGRTINISEGGMMFETHIPIDPQLTLSLTIALEDDLMDFKGRIIHSLKNSKGRFVFGIQFIEMDELKLRFLKQYLLILKEQDNSSL